MREEIGQGLQGVAVVFDHKNPQTLARTVCVFCSIFAHFRVPQGNPYTRIVGSSNFLEKSETGMIITLGVLGLSFRISNPSGQLAWIAVICLTVYVASFAISLGPIFWLLIAEIYPPKICGLAGETAATFNWASNLIVSLTFLTLVEKLGANSTFVL
jgi:Sugar (and other) transporter